MNAQTSKSQTETTQKENHLFSLKKRLSAFGLLFAILFSTFFGTWPSTFSAVQAAQDDRNRPLTQPLSPDDPRAQLDPSLLGVPEIPQPASKKNKEEQLRPKPAANEAFEEAVDFDVMAKQEKLSLIDRSRRPAAGALAQEMRGAAGNLGSVAMFDSTDLNELDGQKGQGRGPRSVIGSDDRVRIYNTAAYPWRTMCKLYLTFPDGSSFIGSGVLIGYKYVLTAGHCVYSHANGGWASSIQVIPGLSGTYKPYGSAWATYFRSFTGWTHDADSDYDFALVTLDRNIGNTTGWLGYAYYPFAIGITGNLGGYPGDLAGGLGLYYDYGTVLFDTFTRVFYNIDTFGGQSGSGVYRIEDGHRYVFAVHTNGGSLNAGCKITSSRFDRLGDWMATGY